MSDHTKLYGICENKCFVEVSPKTDVEQAQADIEAEATARASADTTLQTNIDGKVSKSGDTMTGSLIMSGNVIPMTLLNPTSGDGQYSSYLSFKVASTEIARLYGSTDNDTHRHYGIQIMNGSASSEVFSAHYNDGSYKAMAVHPQTSTDSSNCIATTSWVNKIDNDVVHKSRAETISGAKTFTGSIVFRGSNEVFGETPFIDFHYGNATIDYTSRIINNADGQFAILTKTVDGSSTITLTLSASNGLLSLNKNPSNDVTGGVLVTADWVNTKLATKSNTSHTHDDRYYTESEVNTLLANKNKVTTFSSKTTLISLIENGKQGDMFGITVEGTVLDYSTTAEVTMTIKGFFSLMTLGDTIVAIGSGFAESEDEYYALTSLSTYSSILTFHASGGTTHCRFVPKESAESVYTASGYYISI